VAAACCALVQQRLMDSAWMSGMSPASASCTCECGRAWQGERCRHRLPHTRTPAPQPPTPAVAACLTHQPVPRDECLAIKRIRYHRDVKAGATPTRQVEHSRQEGSAAAAAHASVHASRQALTRQKCRARSVDVRTWAWTAWDSSMQVRGAGAGVRSRAACGARCTLHHREHTCHRRTTSVAASASCS
jgi:hypothetical protein